MAERNEAVEKDRGSRSALIVALESRETDPRKPYRCELVARVPRTWCRTAGVHQVHVSWARQGSGFTLMMEALIMLLSAEMPVDAMADLIVKHDTRLFLMVRDAVSRPWEPLPRRFTCTAAA
jgi:hypothetical protein